MSFDDDLDIELARLKVESSEIPLPCCKICETTDGALLTCSGPCLNVYHHECIDLRATKTRRQFMCDECQSNLHTCFVCKKPDKVTVQCSVPGCGHFYHSTCLKGFALAEIKGTKFKCPLHKCLSCFTDDNGLENDASKHKLIKCIRCPTAYHAGDICIAAGSQELPGLNMICSLHPNIAPKPASNFKHFSASWCFVCSKGGDLLCCERCPASFHLDCITQKEMPRGEYLCDNCLDGVRPRYGDLVWAKLGIYRWWPGEIHHPRNLPPKLELDKSGDIGDFPVYLFGEDSYCWLQIGRVFGFEEGDEVCKNVHGKSKINQDYRLGLEEIKVVFEAREQFRESIFKKKIPKRPPAYKSIRSNCPIGDVQVCKVDPSEVPACQCKPTKHNCDDESCLNRALMVECHPQSCPCSGQCQNQRFVKRLYPKAAPFLTPDRGWGLKAMQKIKEGEFVNEYIGDLIDKNEARKRLDAAASKSVTSFYMLTLDNTRIIDAGPTGNLSRFMNHCCEPNCQTQKWTVNGDVRIGLFALSDIQQDEELTFNYNLDCLGNKMTKCLCNAKACSGFIGLKPKEETQRPKRSVTRKRKRLGRDGQCFICKKNGEELLTCSALRCDKVYHLGCVGETRMTKDFVCPRHICRFCKDAARKLCTKCIFAYCAFHAPRMISTDSKGVAVCNRCFADECNAKKTSSTPTPRFPRKAKGDSSSSNDERVLSELPTAVNDARKRARVVVKPKRTFYNGKRQKKRSRSLTASVSVSDVELDGMDCLEAGLKDLAEELNGAVEESLKNGFFEELELFSLFDNVKLRGRKCRRISGDSSI